MALRALENLCLSYMLLVLIHMFTGGTRASQMYNNKKKDLKKEEIV